MEKKNTDHFCYLRTHRRTWGLTQKELAEIIGNISDVQISRYENGKRVPRLEIALACQVIFGVPPSLMFPDTYTLVEEEVMRNMGQMDLALENTSNPSGIRKRELFSLAQRRSIGSSPSFSEL